MTLLERMIRARMEQHRENLRLWESGYLTPTEPDPEERWLIKERLRACIQELGYLLEGGEATMSDFQEPERPPTARLSDVDIEGLVHNMRMVGPRSGEVYEHYTGGIYTIVCQCYHKDNHTLYIVYHSNMLGMDWLQTLDQFQAIVTLDDGMRVPRFRRHPK
jgi:hypothetical protein